MSIHRTILRFTRNTRNNNSLFSIHYRNHIHSNNLIQSQRYFASKPKHSKQQNIDTKTTINDVSETNIETNTPISTTTIMETESESKHQSNTESESSSTWKMRWFKFRRICMIVGIPLAISSSIFALHDSDIPYVYAMNKLKKHPLPDDYDPSAYSPENPPPKLAPAWAQQLPMFWASWVHAHSPDRIMKHWKVFMPLLDPKYPENTRMVGIACLIGMLSGGQDTMPPHVFYAKCLRKLEILNGYRSSEADGGWTTQKFLNMLYSLCGETDNQQLMFAGLQLLLDLTSIPSDVNQKDIDFVMKHTEKLGVPNMKADLAKCLLQIYQDPLYVVDFCTHNPPKQNQKAFLPDFGEIKRILVKNDCMKFAFKLLDAKSMQLQQMAMFLLIGIVGRYPSTNELKEYLGDNDDEKIQNGIKLVDSLARMGQEHFNRGENEAALGAFQEAIKFFPTSAQLRYLVGKCLSELQRIDEAKMEYRKAMALSPAMNGPMPEATLRLCNLLIKYPNNMSDFEDAIEYLTAMIDRNYYIFQTVEVIDVQDCYDRLVLCLEKLQRFDEALDRLLELCKLKPHAHQVHFETGRMALLCNEYDLAKEHLAYCVHLEPFDMFAKYHLAMALFHLNEFDDAKVSLFHVLESKPKDEKALNLMAKIHIKQNEWKDALEIYQKLEANDPFVQYQIGCCYEHLGKELQSVECFQSTIDSYQDKVNVIGFDNYFKHRPKDRKALQKIQQRCDSMRDSTMQWTHLKETSFNLGMSL